VVFSISQVIPDYDYLSSEEYSLYKYDLINLFYKGLRTNSTHFRKIFKDDARFQGFTTLTDWKISINGTTSNIVTYYSDEDKNLKMSRLGRYPRLPPGYLYITEGLYPQQNVYCIL
jgi:hypothetical protein